MMDPPQQLAASSCVCACHHWCSPCTAGMSPPMSGEGNDDSEALRAGLAEVGVPGLFSPSVQEDAIGHLCSYVSPGSRYGNSRGAETS